MKELLVKVTAHDGEGYVTYFFYRDGTYNTSVWKNNKDEYWLWKIEDGKVLFKSLEDFDRWTTLNNDSDINEILYSRIIMEMRFENSLLLP